VTELHSLDAHDQAHLLRTGAVTSVDLVTHHLERIEALDPSLGAFVTVTADAALEQAARADERRAAGGDLPPFLGVPTAFKDLTFTAGVRTTMGSPVLVDFVPPVSAYVVTLVERAGFISLGKTNTPEFGLSSFTDNDIVGETRTPWDTTRNAGGSSGGAAAAVAAGLVPLAPGSDGGGSIRIPASCCGIVGFKPSRGRVSAGPIGSDWSGLAGDGTLARSVRDAAALLDAMAHPMPGDLRPLPDPPVPFADWTKRDPGRLRIARWAAPYLPGIGVDASSMEAWESASRLLESLGHEVVEIENPFPAELEPQFNVVWSSGMAAAWEFLPTLATGQAAPGERELRELPPAETLLRASTRYWLDRGTRATAVQLAHAIQFLEATTRDILTRLSEFDAWLTPTLAKPPQPTKWFTDAEPAEIHLRELQFTPFTAVYNMAGVPAASLPLHWTVDGLPIGVMLAGRPGEDGPLFALLAQVEAAVAGFTRRPAE
jgi:amidase